MALTWEKVAIVEFYSGGFLLKTSWAIAKACVSSTASATDSFSASLCRSVTRVKVPLFWASRNGRDANRFLTDGGLTGTNFYTATTLMHEAGIPPALVQAMVGHDSETMHQHYIGVGQEAMKAAANELPELKKK
jgi:hypothetical protein